MIIPLNDHPISVLNLSEDIQNAFTRVSAISVGDVLDLLQRVRSIHPIPEGYSAIVQNENQFREIIARLKATTEYKLDKVVDMFLDFDVDTQQKRVKWLTNTQLPNGSWYHDLDITAGALLSFIRLRENYDMVDISKGITWLKANRNLAKDLHLSKAINHVITFYQNISPLSKDVVCQSIAEFPSVPASQEYIAYNLQDLRKIAIRKGNAVRVGKEYTFQFPDRNLGQIYSHAELAWMTVGKPRVPKPETS